MIIEFLLELTIAYEQTNITIMDYLNIALKCLSSVKWYYFKI